MRLVKDYMQQDELRHALNGLTRDTFGFDFEDWYQAGCWEGDYIPYSYEEAGRLVSNVSVNRMSFSLRGTQRHYIQLGTVMTAAADRRHGYASALLRQALAEAEPGADGVYLFANLNALGFYEKQGFFPVTESRYYLRERPCIQSGGFVPVSAAGRADYFSAVRRAAVQSALEQTNRFSLQAFYTADMHGVFYCAALDCYAVLRQQGGELELQSVICPHRLPLEQVICRIDQPYTRLRLGFAPLDEDAGLFEPVRYDGADDYRLLCRGDELRRIEDEQLIFPVLSHA